ncbi:S8 family serine peptidase [Microbacterium sp. EYE_5]|uniref:S8 family serine peptidase n=1 Tax=unclassified Microbacterium TaxID=2609290 RepID=UPI0020062257|nr:MULTISPECIES: S8 family serine peptidase [unclassified Microbacterium]MCK6081108.1 S8 family serine peptidase [Microbacterium sp. EYE_382]MCK6086378.1 S8 family serine peptidase [Microbacterium sp. EYE_384]MCK6124124.1 S8 family serine peptidase [Microbacterium sp. EYE_80]MCK6127033.1 S8 family serine peptidase [Microbacterium sp. EYE_79]MCK6142063.1 S8 family serine peptidase [Microbacterium sp. EYE_39]
MRPARGAVAAALITASALLSAATPAPSAPAVDPVRNMEYWLDEYGVTDAWKTTKGEGTTIAVIDTGVGRGPRELDGAVVGGADFSGVGTPDGRTPIGDGDADHGSWVASLAAGRGTGSGKGMVGVAPEADLLSLSIGFGKDATVPFVDQVAEAIRWAVDHGADVINLSFTTNTLDWDRSWDDAFLYAFDHDAVVIVAAGNRESGTEEVGAPATIPGVLTVGGVDRDRRASNSASTQGITIGVSAPSEELLGVSANGDLVVWEGTSGAAPIVAGIAALVRAAHPDLDAANVINRIVSTATKPARAKSTPDVLYGYGLVDAAAAVTRPVAIVEENPMGDLREWIRLYRRAESTPAPSPTPTPVTVAPLPEAEPPSGGQSALLPSPETLRYGTVPLVVLSLGTILIVLGVTAAARRIRSARTPRPPSR